MILSACPTGICRCWCNATNRELLTHELALSWDESNIIQVHPQVAALLASNDVPPDSEATICQSSIHTIEQDVEIIDTHIAHLQGIVNGLQALKQKRVEDSRPYRKILHPVRRLPVEILSKIFRDACPPLRIEPMASRLDFESSINADRCPWTLTLVSSRWRQVALSAPRIWSTIIINLEVTRNRTVGQLEWTDAHSHLLALQLQRSRPSLLTVVIVTHTPLPLDHPLLPTLLHTSPRWERLAVWNESLRALSPIQGKLSALHTLQLAGDVSQAGSRPRFAHFSVAPKLHTVYTVVYLPLPFSQITEFATSRNVDVNILAKLISVEWCFLRALWPL